MTDGSTSAIGADDRLSLAFLGDPNSIHLRRWVSYFAGRGHRVTLLVPRAKVVEPGLPATVAVEPFTHFATGRRVTPASLLRGRRSVRRAVARVHPDILNAHFLTVHGWNAWMSGFHPYVVTLWGSDVLLHPKESHVAAFLARIALRAADMVMVNSGMLMRGALAAGASPERTEMFQFGVDLTQFTPGPDPAALRARLGLQGRRVIFSPRGITPLYRHGVVIEALPRMPSDVVVLMSRFRAQPDELTRIERKAEALGLSDRVVMVPEIEHAEMPDFYRLADVVVSVPASDSTAVTNLEALACGRPIVAADLPSVREWLGELDNAVLVPVDDVEATAAALRQVLDQRPEIKAERGLRARSIVVERADQARSLARVESLYLDLVRRRARNGGEVR